LVGCCSTNQQPDFFHHRQAFPSWPAISALGGQELAMESGVAHPIQMSPIPTETPGAPGLARGGFGFQKS